ncbi:MAG: tRNA (adenosine(37)-N6)-threonylcarbamoyltransferase complex dimerization subunit type 1 TsaB [Planctomycetota bacterium]
MAPLTVALETSSRPASVAAAMGGEAPLVSVLDDSRAHASDLLPHLAELVRSMGRGPFDIERVVVGTGPGSYTGLRVGSATGLGLAIGSSGSPSDGEAAFQAELIGIPSFEALAFEVLEAGERAAVLRNAFGGHIYLASYGRSSTGVIEFQAPTCMRPEEAKVILGCEGVWIADKGALDAVAGVVAEPANVRDAEPNAGALLRLARARGVDASRHGAAAVQPLYLRPFEAKVRKR